MELCSWKDLQGFCSNVAKELNDMFGGCVSIIKQSPFDIAGIGDLVNKVITAIAGTALTLCLLFFLMEFAKKSMDLQWVKWENILLFCLKLVLAKVVVEHSQDIMIFIFDAFTKLVEAIEAQVGSLSNGFLQIGPCAAGHGSGCDGAESLFLTDAEIELFDGDGTGDSGAWFGFDRLIKMVLELGILTLVMKGILVVAVIMIFARMFELIVYTMVSPIPLSTFASEEHRSVALGFIKGYAAVCLQGLMIIVMFYAFSAMGSFISGSNGWLSGAFALLVRTLVLGLGVFKSGSWAKKLCGAM